MLVALITVAMEVRLGGPQLCRGTPWSLVGRGPVRRVLKNEEGIIEPGRTCPGNTGDFCRGACTAGGRVRETECSVRRFSRGLQEERQGQGTPELRPEGRGRSRREEGETQPPGPPRGGARAGQGPAGASLARPPRLRGVRALPLPVFTQKEEAKAVAAARN